MSKRSITTGPIDNIRKSRMDAPPKKKQRDTLFEDLTSIERAIYIKNEYWEHPEWLIDYPHSIKRKCVDLTDVQKNLYEYYRILPNPTQDDAILFLTYITARQILTAGI